MTTAITPERDGTGWRAEVSTARMLAVTWCATREDAESWVAAMQREMRR